MNETYAKGSTLTIDTRDVELYRELCKLGDERDNPLQLLGRKWLMENIHIDKSITGTVCQLVWTELVEIGK